jgi:hypothetical protein
VDETLLVDPENRGISNVVVSLHVRPGQSYPAPHPSYTVTANGEVSLESNNCRFEPHVTLLQSTQTLVFRNREQFAVNLKIDTIRNMPVNPIVRPNESYEVAFSREERHPSRVTSSIHPWMDAWVVIKVTPYVAVTGVDGAFAIENLPQGKWRFHVWHEAAGNIEAVTVNGNGQQWVKGLVEFEVQQGMNSLNDVLVETSEFE